MRAAGLRRGIGLLLILLLSAGFFGLRLIYPFHALLVRVQFSTALGRLLAAGSLAAALAAGGILALLMLSSLLLGRVYCGILCPLGHLQDLIAVLRRRPYRKQARFGALHIGISLTAWIFAVGGVMMLINLIGPYALFGRFLRDLAAPLAAGATNILGRGLMPLGIYLPPYPLTIHPGAALLTGVCAAALTVAVLLSGRLFCNTLCPVGGLLRIASVRPRYAVRLDEAACIACGACVARCPAGCIDLEQRKVDSGRCLLCLECLDGCPTSALSYGPSISPHAGKSQKGEPDINRRSFIRLTGLSTLSLGLLAGGCATRSEDDRILDDGSLPGAVSPPGSAGISRFASHCIACHLCVSRCPTRVLQPALFAYGFKSINQPFMDFASGFCEYECIECGQACPTGAILPLSVAEKRRTQIGEARFIEDRCIVITEGTACGACAEVCPTGAARMVAHKDLLTIPITTPEVCIGCGHCENACPAEPQKAIIVAAKDIHGRALPAIPKEEPKAAGEELRVDDTSAEDEFPF